VTLLATQAVADVRQLSSLFNNNLYSDAQVIKLFNDGASELYDFIVGQFETWFLTSVDFTLGGGVGGNIFPMPMTTLLKDNTLEKDPTLLNPTPVPRLGSWSDRNSLSAYGVMGGRRYYPAGSNLMVFPPGNSAGNYRLWYTPKYIPIGIPQTVPSQPFTTATLTNVAGGTGIWSFSSAAWDATWIGQTIFVTGSVNTGNNGQHVITAVNDLNNIVTSNVGLVTETPGVPLANGVTVQPQNTALTFNVVMEPWYLYPEIHAAISIRTSRQQDTSDLQPKLAALKQRIMTATANRTEEVPQSPLRDFQYGRGNSYNSDGGF
jgi:hypothetical protein